MTLPSRLALGVSIAAILSCAPAGAAEISAKSAVREAVVHPDGAEVVRTAEFQVPEGHSTLVFKGLPSGLDSASIRVSGDFDGALTFGSVETRSTPVEAQNPDSSAPEKVRTLKRSREVLKVKAEALETELSMVKRYSQSSPFLSPEVKQPSRNLSGPRDWTESFESIRSAMDKAGTDLQEVRVRIHDVDDQISALQPTVPAPYYPQATTLDATVDVDAGSASHARIRLSYRVSNAWWRPVYDARLDTRKGALELVRRAEVRQSSGEDWKDASLSVSTTRTSGRTAPPSINSLVVNLVEPRPALAMAEMSARSVQGRTPVYAEYSRESLPIPSTMADGSAQKLFGPATPKVMVAATEASASVDFGNFSASFVIPGKISVSGDGAPRSFRIGSKTTAPDLIVKTVPSVAATAYLQAHAVNGDDAPLLPGPVNLFRDGTYAGKGAIQQVGPGEPYDIGFGVDDSVKVTRVPVVVSKSDPNWYSRSNADVRDFKTTVKNLHSIPVKIVVNDRIPVAGHDDIKIETLEQSTPATEKDVDGKTGVLGWTYDLAAGASKEIRLAYKVSWPSGRAIDMTR